MDTDKDMFMFFNEFMFLDHSKDGIDFKIDILGKYILNRFHKTIPPTRMLIVLSLIDDIILKLHRKDLKDIQNDMYDLRENVMYMLSFERVVKEKS